MARPRAWCCVRASLVIGGIGPYRSYSLMKDAELIQFVEASRVFAVVRAASAESAVRSAEAAIVGGIKVIEVTLATPGSFRVISDLRHRYGDRVCVCAGSVTNHDQMDRAIKSGAQVISMPHTNGQLVESCASGDRCSYSNRGRQRMVDGSANGQPVSSIIPGWTGLCCRAYVADQRRAAGGFRRRRIRQHC
jgi:KDPG and KHG aldolase